MLSNAIIRGAAMGAALALSTAASKGADAQAPEAAPPETYPYIEGELELELGNDFVFRSTDDGNEINDLFLEGTLGLKIGLTPIFSVNAGLKLEPVEDPQPFEDRHFGDIGLFVETLNLQADIGPASISAGKIGPGFGKAWDVTPGIFGTDLAEDYELSEQVGFSAAYRLETAAMGAHTLGGHVFFADTSALSDSIFTSRGRLSRSDGGAGNTGRLDNVSLTLDGEDMPGLPGFTYTLGYRHLSAGIGDAFDENGFVAGASKETALSSGLVVGLIGELAYFSHHGGTEDDAVYATSGVSLVSGPWHGELAASLRRFDFAGGGSQSDHLVQVSGGYEFDNGLDLSLGYGLTRDGGTDSHVIGLRLARSFAFSTR